MTATLRAQIERSTTLNADRGLRGTWLWTWLSVLSIMFFAYGLPVWSLVMTEQWRAREIALSVAVLASAVVSTVFVRELRSGLGQRSASLLSRSVLLGVATVPWLIASVTPSLSIEWALIPWMAASLIAVDLTASLRWYWMAAAALALLLLRVGGASIAGASADFAQIDAIRGTIAFPVLFIMLPVATVFQFWLWQVVLSLDAAKSERAELARAQERLRFASDLHNIQGHHLQVIALKSELAERILSRDPDAAAALIRETQALAREALEDTRRLVKGYRAVSFATEAENAASVLEAAGIRVNVDLVVDPPTELDHLLGTQLREATTNIIRHSKATYMAIVLNRDAHESITLSISNDGAADVPLPSDGTGIIGLSEQFEAAGGSLTARTEAGQFTLRGVLPQNVGAK